MRVRWPHVGIRVELFNVRFAVRKPFLQVTEGEVDRVATTIKAAFAFSCEAITAFQGQAIDVRGKQGTLLFISPIRANTGGSALRSLSQKLNKELGRKMPTYAPQFYYAHCMFTEEPFRPFVFFPFPLSSDDPSLHALQVVIDGGAY